MNTEHTKQSRAQFEAWASEHCYAVGGISFKRFSDDGADSVYNDPNVETAWQAWQAASQQQAEPVAWRWQPIDTAPKDGSHILLWWNGEARLGFWLDNSHTRTPWAGWRAPSLQTVPFGILPTHWAPMPPSPDAAQPPAVAVPGEMPATGREKWTVGEWCEHFGGRHKDDNPLNYYEFGSVWAIAKMLESFSVTQQRTGWNACRAAMLAAAPQAADPIKRLIAIHNELLGEYPYCYFELAYTRRTDWMAWLCTKPREDDPERKVLACGQGLTAEEACAEAVSAAQKGGAA